MTTTQMLSNKKNVKKGVYVVTTTSEKKFDSYGKIFSISSVVHVFKTKKQVIKFLKSYIEHSNIPENNLTFFLKNGYTNFLCYNTLYQVDFKEYDNI